MLEMVNKMIVFMTHDCNESMGSVEIALCNEATPGLTLARFCAKMPTYEA